MNESAAMPRDQLSRSLYQQYVSASESWHNWLEHLPRFRFACVERSGYE